ncbi:MAG: hydantoinase/oxoprolinase N-terminal domain-containing protein [Syntrophobacteraceae bacterium]
METGSSAECGIGIDTGGTYTDAVVIDLATKEVLGSAKTPTTHYRLSAGITTAIRNAMSDAGVVMGSIATIALSTTLATNAVVENKGADVGLFMIGFNRYLDLPAVAVKYIDGGCTLKGEEREKLDIEELVAGLEDLKGNVDAYAVCGEMSIVNPVHELTAAKAIGLIDPKPVFCSHMASCRYGMKERAATAVLNARLMPIMRDFLDGINDSLKSLGFQGKVIIVRGDATAMNVSEAPANAASTVASGPAASAFYGASFSPFADALVVDIGGTTTDLTIIENGKPRINEEGIVIGSWGTHIEAVEMFTFGIGGDSHVKPGKDALEVGPGRVLPLAMAERPPDLSGWRDRNSEPRYAIANTHAAPEIAERSRVLRFLREHGPATPLQLEQNLGVSTIRIDACLRELGRAQLVTEVGFTPTDALHALGRLDIGNRAAALRGAEVLAERQGIGVEDFCLEVLEATERKIEDAILLHVIRREIGLEMTDFLAHRRNQSMLKFDISLNIPIIGLGAAARHFLPNIAASLGSEAFFPDRFEVGNALGAILIAAQAAVS